ncbi:MAG: MATE family efflux transporter [Candidatus Moduliflexus flocculans]|nr:MATE family efflux transporter [Candidatus Moduliflexus flocculans]
MRLGAHDHEGVERHATNGLLIAFSLGVLFSAFAFVFRTQIVGIFAIPDPETERLAISYVSICGGLLVFQFVSAGFGAIYEGLGKTVVNLGVMSVGLVMNMILDPLFILVFRMGVGGAALATVIAQACTLSTYLVLYFTYSKRYFLVHPRQIDAKAIKNILRIGLPAGVQSMFFTVISILIARLILVEFGTVAMAASRIGSQIEQFTWMIGGGFQTAITVFVGQNFGAGKFDRIRRGTLGLSALLMPYAAIIAVLFALRAEALVRLFVDEADTVAFSTEHLSLISFAQPFMMLEAIGGGLFNGVGLSKIPSFSGIVGNVLRIPLAKLLIPTLAQAGVWWALNLSDAFKGGFLLLAGVFFFRLEKVFAARAKKNRAVEAIPAL